jgi:hypothetical protein
MSELIETNNNRATVRWKLLASVSALALTANVVSIAKADASDHPQVWIELGGQLEHLSGQPSALTPSFFALASPSDVQLMTDTQRPSQWSIGGEGKIAFTPDGTNWIFSAAIRYGRSNKSDHRHHQSPFISVERYIIPFIPTTTKPLFRAVFADAAVDFKESHAVLDFMAGKDVGLGMFGGRGSSVVSAGVRFAQFVSKTDTSLYARPVVEPNQITPIPGKYKWAKPFYQTYTAFLRAERSTHAVGPSLGWEASMPIAGNGADSELTLDWGVNGAVLFGRQRVNIHHQSVSNDYYLYFGSNYIAHHTPHTVNRKVSRFAVVPNLGGFAGVSLKFPNAKVSMGYRADFFFNAVDNGIDTRHVVSEGFYGPFASISVGLGG